VEQVERRSSLLLVASFVLIRKELVQSQHGSVGDRHIPESVDISVSSVRNSYLVEAALDEVAEILCEQRCQPVTEAAGRELSSAVEL
jgi:hypothetical protein